MRASALILFCPPRLCWQSKLMRAGCECSSKRDSSVWHSGVPIIMNSGITHTHSRTHAHKHTHTTHTHTSLSSSHTHTHTYTHTHTHTHTLPAQNHSLTFHYRVVIISIDNTYHTLRGCTHEFDILLKSSVQNHCTPRELAL